MSILCGRLSSRPSRHRGLHGITVPAQCRNTPASGRWGARPPAWRWARGPPLPCLQENTLTARQSGAGIVFWMGWEISLTDPLPHGDLSEPPALLAPCWGFSLPSFFYPAPFFAGPIASNVSVLFSLTFKVTVLVIRNTFLLFCLDLLFKYTCRRRFPKPTRSGWLN